MCISFTENFEGGINMSLLEIKNLNVCVDGKEVLKGLNLEIDSGAVNVLMGPNGSGKSTLANVLMGNSKYKIISGEILFFFAENIKSNIRALEGCINKIKAYSQLTNLSPDMNLAKSIVSEISPGLKNITASKTSIIDAVSSHFGLTPQLILGNSRNSSCVNARQICMYILREDLNLSLAETSQTTGKKHSSVIYSCNQIIKNLRCDSSLLSDIASIRSAISRKLNN